MAEHPAYERRIADGKSRIVHLKGVKALKETLATYLSSMGSFFALCDANGDGTIDRGEFQRAVLALGLPGDFPEAVLRRVADEVYSERHAAQLGRLHGGQRAQAAYPAGRARLLGGRPVRMAQGRLAVRWVKRYSLVDRAGRALKPY